MRRISAFFVGLILLLSPLLIGAPAHTAQAATCTVTTTADGRPYVAPTATGPGSGKTVGFDATHGETAGAADWVINGGMSDFACGLAGQGYAVEEIRAYPFTATNLNPYAVVVIPEPNIPFTTAEESALVSFVGAGHGLLMIADHYQADRNLNTWDAAEVFNGWRRGHYGATYTSPYYWYNGTTTTSTYTFNNEDDWMANNFGMRFHFNAMDMPSGVTGFTAGNPSDPDDPGVLPASQTFNITSGITSVASHAGSTLAITDYTKAMGIVYPNKNKIVRWASAQSTDELALYTDSVGTPACGSATMGGRCEGPYVAVSKPSAGKVAAIGDSSAWEDATPKYVREDTAGTKTTHAGWSEVNDAALAINLVNWLATSDATVGIPTSLQQQNSPEPYSIFTVGEPLTEPWSTPTAGYKWYDARTFKAGSYNNTTLYGGGGGGGGDTTAPTVSISAPTAGATVSGTTTVSASASDNVGVTKVEFYVDGTLKSTDTASPWSYSWDTTTATNGSHSLTAKAYDAANNVGTSSAVSVTVSNATGGTTANETFTGTLDATTTTDDFWIDVTAAGSISMNLSWTGTASLNLYLYNPSGTQVASKSGTTSPVTLTYSATATGRYKLHVTRSSGTANFTLTASHPISTATAAYSQSGSLAAGGYQNFTLTVGAAGTINLKLSFPSGADYDLYLINSAGTTVASATSSTLNPETLSYIVSGAGTYTVQVQSYSGSGSFTVTGYYPK